MNITSSLNVLLKSLALVGSLTLLPAISPFGFAGDATPRLPSKASGQVVNPKNAAKPGTPCCQIIGIDTATGVVKAKVNSTGKSFQFKVADAALLISLKTGQAVYANLKTQQVSVDGATTCCRIIDGGVGAFHQDVGSAANPAGHCCQITSIDATGRVTAQDKATGKPFQFQVNDTNLLTSLHVGQSVSANFSTSQVAIAEDTPCCEIVSTGVTSHAGVTNTAGTSGSQAKPVPADDLPGIRMQIRELKHTTNSVTLRFTLFNDGNAAFAIGYNFGGWGNIQNVRLVDPVSNKSYSVTLANGCQCSENVHDVAPKSQVDLWAKFAVPPKVKLATVTIPHFTPVEDVPISKP